jgi:hypothetical protein
MRAEQLKQAANKLSNLSDKEMETSPVVCRFIPYTAHWALIGKLQ